ncbi:MAG: M48 family metallopeptidase [Thermodesulfobacteriota bacterium]
MKDKLTLAVIALLLLSCAKVPITGRSQLNLVPEAKVLSLSHQQYDDFLQEHKVIKEGAQAAMVQRVGRGIQQAVENYLGQQGMADELAAYDWQFNLVDSPEKNAFCMPGGKVVIYTGILPLTADETGLAVVMGHEVAHAVANHGSERMSQGMLTKLGGMSLAVAMHEQPRETKALALLAFGVGSQVGVLLPYSRLHESEADHLGLVFMAMAGYDPRQAPSFWQRMAAGKEGAPPELLSTHPADETRMNELEKLMPEALKYYAAGGAK